MAAPFVQGRLRKEYVSVQIETRCAHCDRSLHITVDGDMRITVQEQAADPFVFMPDVDWEHFAERTIIDAF
jgi:hypothetical protein